MGLVYSTRFFVGTLAAATVTTLYTVDSAHVAVVKDINVFSTASSGIVNVQAGDPGPLGIIYYLAQSSTIPWNHWTGMAVIPPGGTIIGYSQNAGTQLYVSGYLLTLP